MGIRSKDHPEILIFDLGMARMYTDGIFYALNLIMNYLGEGCLRPPRTTVPFRGTPEWASGHAAKGREQSRFDDLIAWLYVIVELFDKSDARQPLPWTAMNNAKVSYFLLISTHFYRQLRCLSLALFRHVYCSVIARVSSIA
jgi:hypothetical protein